MSARRGTAVVPVLRLAVVETESQTVLLARCRELGERVAPERRRLDDVPVRGLGVKHREAVMVLRGDHDVLHPRVLGDAHPLVRVVIDRVELLGVRPVPIHGDLALMHDPLADPADRLAVVHPRGHRVHAPVDEHPEARLAEPLHPDVALGGRLGGVRVGVGLGAHGGHKDEGKQRAHEATLPGCPGPARVRADSLATRHATPATLHCRTILRRG